MSTYLYSMQELRDAYTNPPENSVPDVPSHPRRVETDFYSGVAPAWTPTGKQVMEDVRSKTCQDRNFSDVAMTTKGSIVTSVPDVKAPEAAALYLKRLLDARGCSGPYEVHDVTHFGPFTNLNFQNTIGSMCPLCKVVHDGYSFSYKVKKNTYGGWKCWKDDSWETQYVWDSIDIFD